MTKGGRRLHKFVVSRINPCPLKYHDVGDPSVRSYPLRLLFFSRTKITSALPSIPSLGGLCYILFFIFVRFSLIFKLCSYVLCWRLVTERTRSILLSAIFCVFPTTVRYLCWRCDLLGLRTLSVYGRTRASQSRRGLWTASVDDTWWLVSVLVVLLCTIHVDTATSSLSRSLL